MIKSARDLFSVSKIFSTYTWSNIVKYPSEERFQINLTTFLRCLCSPKDAIGNVFIIQGGVLHFNTKSYYIRTTCSLLPKNLRVFVFETLYPACNYKFAHDVANCLTFIKREFSGKICVIGYSMGGILLYTYLSLGYDQADLYIPVCCPLDMDRFLKVISENILFKILQQHSCNRYNVKSYEDLLQVAGTSMEESLEFHKSFVLNLNGYKENWVSKTIYILSSNDPVTTVDDLELFEENPITYIIKGGWHCDIESILLTVTLTSQFIESSNSNISELSVSYGAFDVINNLKK